jgi:hypothetical protein
LQAIREHVDAAVRHAESGYSSAQEEEDTITGELGGALRTKGVQVVNVTDAQVSGTWRWSISYSKFKSKAQGATESIVGADGILEIRVDSPERDQQKSALFQAKNTQKRDPKLVEQCARMCVWREASFVLNYTANGYNVYSLDDILLSGGSIADVRNYTRLAPWIIDTFIACQVGHPDLYYDKDERRLYWLPQQSSEGEYRSDRWVWVDFRPKHLIHIDVIPPDWERSRAKEIAPNKIPLNRLAFTPEDLFGLEAPFTLAQLRGRRAELLRAYHSDKNYHLPMDLKSLLDGRVIEINKAFVELYERADVSKKPRSTQKASKAKSPSALEEPRTSELDEFLRKGKVDNRAKVRVRKKT